MVAMLQGLREKECVSYGLSAAVQSLYTKQTVPSTLRYELLKKPLNYVELPVTGNEKSRVNLLAREIIIDDMVYVVLLVVQCLPSTYAKLINLFVLLLF